MKISKHSHACLLVEAEGFTVLIDPGVFTTQENTLDTTKLRKLDYILITHEHADHMSPQLIKQLLAAFPLAQIITNKDVVAKLKEDGVEATTEVPPQFVVTTVPHEDILITTPPLNTQFDLFKKLTHPGDSHSFTTTKEVLALPVNAPWGSLVDSLKLAIKLKPKAVIPIHDWHWHEQARLSSYHMAEKALSAEGIRFIPLTNGEVVEV